jgi:hypothetical protein
VLRFLLVFYLFLKPVGHERADDLKLMSGLENLQQEELAIWQLFTAFIRQILGNCWYL